MWSQNQPGFLFLLKDKEEGTCRYFYAHENNTVMEISKLVCTQDGTVNLKEKLQKIEVDDQCTRERAKIIWRFCKHTNAPVMASLLKSIPTVCKDAVIP